MHYTRERIAGAAKNVTALLKERRALDAKAEAWTTKAEALRRQASKASTKAYGLYGRMEKMMAQALVDFGICPDTNVAIVSIRNTPGCIYKAIEEGQGDPLPTLQKMFRRSKARIQKALDAQAAERDSRKFDVDFILPEQVGTLRVFAASQEAAEKAFTEMTIYEVVADCDNLQEEPRLVEKSSSLDPDSRETK